MSPIDSQYPELADANRGHLPYYEPQSGHSIATPSVGYPSFDEIVYEDDAPLEPPHPESQVGRLRQRTEPETSHDGDFGNAFSSTSSHRGLSPSGADDYFVDSPSDDPASPNDDAPTHESNPGRGRIRGRGRGRGRGEVIARGRGRSQRPPPQGGYLRGQSRGRPRGVRGRSRVPRGEGARGGGRGVPRGPHRLPDPGPVYQELIAKANHAYIAMSMDEAGDFCRQAIELNPNVFNAYALMGRVLEERGDKQGAFATEYSALSVCRSIDSLWRMVNLALDLRDKGDSEIESRHLMSIYTAILHRDSNNIQARKGRLQIFERTGHSGRAFRECQKLIDLAPHDLDVLESAAELAVQLNNPKPVIDSYDATIMHLQDIHPNGQESNFSFEDLNYYAELYMVAKDYTGGLVAVKRVARWLCGRSDETFWDSQEDDCEWDDYNEPRREAVERSLKHPEEAYGMEMPMEVRAKLGLFRLWLGPPHHKEAMRHFDVVFGEEASYYADTLAEIANNLYEWKLFADALRFYRVIIEAKYDRKHRLYINVARCLATLGQYVEATEYYEKALKSFPGAEEHVYRAEVAKIYKQLGQVERAQEHAAILIRKGRGDRPMEPLYERGERLVHIPPDSAIGNRPILPATRTDSATTTLHWQPTSVVQFALSEAQPKRRRQDAKRSYASIGLQKSPQNDTEDGGASYNRSPDSRFQSAPDSARSYVSIAPRLSGAQYVPHSPGNMGLEADIVGRVRDSRILPFTEENGILPSSERIAARLARTHAPRQAHRATTRHKERQARPKGTSISALRAQERVCKRQERLEQDERTRASVRNLFDEALELRPLMNSGDETSQDEWIVIVTRLLDIFKTMKEFYPRDPKTKFLGFSAEARARANTGKAKNQPINSAERFAAEIFESDFDFEAGFDVPLEYEGIPFSTWIDLFCELALLHAHRGSLDDCLRVLASAGEANVFRHHAPFLDRIHTVGFTCALILNSEQHLCEESRHFLRTYQHMTDPFRLVAALNRIYDGEASWYRGGPMQKFLLRHIKAMDYALMSDEQRIRFKFTEAEINGYENSKDRVANHDKPMRAGNPHGLVSLDPLPIYQYGEILGSGKGSSWQNSLYYYLRAQAIKPNEPLVLLSICVAYLVGATKRHVENRHQYVVQGISFLRKYQTTRIENVDTSARRGSTSEDQCRRRSECLLHQRRMEIAFNEGRAWHFLGLFHLSIPAYKKVLTMPDGPSYSKADGRTRLSVDEELDLVEEPDFRREAAFALQQIYALQGHTVLARELGEKYLQF